MKGKHVCLMLLLVVLIAARGTAATERCGSLLQNTSWLKSESPYRVTCNVALAPGYTLTIEPGVTVQFDPGTSLIIRGVLNAIGNNDAHIVFTSASLPNKWSGIYLATNQGGKAVIGFADLSYAFTAVSVECCWGVTDPAIISDSSFRNNGIGIGGYAGYKTIVRSSTFENNNIALDSGSKEIYNSVLRANNYGIYNGGQSKIVSSIIDRNGVGIHTGDDEVTRSEITNNGIGIDNWWGAIRVSYSNITGNDVGMIFNGHPQTVENNNIFGNTTYNAKVVGGANRLAMNNWWGTINVAEIDSKIQDGRDNATLGLLTYSPFRNLPISINNRPPTANAGQDQTIIIGEFASFDGTASFDSDGNIVDHQWDFGDGTGTNGAITTHKYEWPGTFSATLIVRDDRGASSNDSASVTVLSFALAIQALSETVAAFNLAQGISNSLDSKLQAAVMALQAINLGRRQDVVNHLTAFINQVEAQRGKGLTDSQAGTLIALATRILALL